MENTLPGREEFQLKAEAQAGTGMISETITNRVVILCVGEGRMSSKRGLLVWIGFGEMARGMECGFDEMTLLGRAGVVWCRIQGI